MKKHLFFIAILFVGMSSCQKENTSLSNKNSNLIIENDESSNRNQLSRMSSSLDVNKLIDNSNLVGLYTSKEFHVDYKLYDTKQTFLEDISIGNNLIQAISIFDDCNNGDFGIGVYSYSTDTKNLSFNFYKDQQSYSENLPTSSYIVNDILINDIMYIRDMKYPKCGVSVFYSDGWHDMEYTTDYNDLRLESGIYPPDHTVVEGGTTGCGWTPNCLRMNGNQCRGHSCATISCGVASFEANLVERNYPNYIYYITEVVLDESYYKLKDDFLMKSELGKKYVDIFYKIQDHLVETLDLDLIGEILATLPQVNTAIKDLLDPSFNGIIVNSSLENKMSSIFSKSIKNSSSQIYKDAITLLATDFNKLANKKKEEVYQIMGVK